MPQGRGANSPVAVIGAGIGGLAVAGALVRMGRPVQVFEQAALFARVGTGVGLAPNAVKAFDGLGLRELLKSRAYQPEYRTSRAWDTGEILLRYPMRAAMEEEYGAPYLLMHRGDPHQALYELLPPGVVRFGYRLQDAEIRHDEAVLTFEAGRTETAAMVIGADGVHSLLRKILLGSEQARYTGKVAYRGVYPATLLPEPLIDPSTKWWGPDRHIVMYYIAGGDEVYFTTAVPEDAEDVESFSAQGDLGDLRRAFEGFHPALTGALAACPNCHKWPIFECDPLSAWYKGPVVLLGDACHPMTPFMQQGAASALEDAAVLARCLVEAGSGDMSEAFARFEQTRKHRTSVMQEGSRRNTRNSGSEGSEVVTQEDIYAYDAWTGPLAA